MLKHQVDHIADITLHIDAEEDGELSAQLATVEKLPMRSEIRGILQDKWKNSLPEDAIKEIIIHYLQEKVHLEVMFNCPEDSDPNQLQQVLKESLQDLQWLHSVRFWAALP